MRDSNLKNFCNLYLLKNLIKKSACFKNPENPRTIDLILTNRPRSFCNSNSLETGFSDFHKLTVTVFTITKSNQLSKSHIFFKLFRTDSINQISSNAISERDLTGFLDACKKLLDYQAPRKKKYTRANQTPFLN